MRVSLQLCLFVFHLYSLLTNKYLGNAHAFRRYCVNSTVVLSSKVHPIYHQNAVKNHHRNIAQDEKHLYGIDLMCFTLTIAHTWHLLPQTVV